MHADKSIDSKPWWHFGHVWLIIAGPAIVVVAAVVTLYLAVTSPNEIVFDERFAPNAMSGEHRGGQTLDASLAPAMQARNHAQTGVVPLPKQPVDKP